MAVRKRRGAWRLVLALVGVMIAFGAWGQVAPPAESPPASAAGSALLDYEGGRSAIGFSMSAGGPLFSLEGVAAALGVELRVGPLAESHRLVFEDKEIIVGPQSTAVVTLDVAGGQSIEELTQMPLAFGGDLRVPRQLLEWAFGEELGLDFYWNPQTLTLDASRRRLREINAEVSLVHQFRVTTLEVRFPEMPRYRVERLPGALEIRFVGDRLRLPVAMPRTEDRLVRGVTATADRIRIELAENTAAADPRLLTTPVPRLVIEIFPQTATEEAGPMEAPRPPRRRASRGELRTLVLDPGHGGSETGAIGKSGTAEKDLVLLIARSLEQRLEQQGLRTVLTRDGDTELSLEARTALANQNQADLFISLHLNSSFGSQAHGAETYFLSREASDQAAAAAAATENLSGGGGGSDLELILWDLAQSHHLGESQRFASLVQEELNQALGLRNRGVKQAPFRVLLGADMPAVLVELGFLSNPREEAELQSSEYRAQLVDALVRAISRFRRQKEARSDASEAPP